MYAGFVLTLYRRHIKGCSARDLPAAAQRHFTTCACPIWIYGRTEKHLFHRQSVGTADWAAADAIRRSYDAAAKDEVVHGPLISDCVERFYAARQHELAPRSYRNGMQYTKRFAQFCTDRGAAHMSDLTVDLLEIFKAEGLPDLAHTTRGMVVSHVRCFLREAFRRGWLKEHLAEKVKPYASRVEQKSPFSDEEVSKLLAGALELKHGRHGFAGHPPTFRLLLELLLTTGMRVGDGVRFDPKLLVRSDRLWVYTYQPQKSIKVRRRLPHAVYLSDELKMRIDECTWLGVLPFDYREWKEGDQTTYMDVWGRMKSIGRRQGIDDCRPHRLRDTFAVRLLLRGVSLDDVSRLLGHSSVRITEGYYAKWIPARARRLEGIVADLG